MCFTDVDDGAGTTSDAVDSELVGSTTAADGDEVAAKRRRMTCSMESVEDKQEKMDDKHCSSSVGTSWH